MTCRNIGWQALAAAGIALALTSCATPARPRNVLVITLDTMRADRLPAYGFSGVSTPALDELAREGMLFEAAFAATPLTLPSHATLFTGLYPSKLGIRDNAGAPLRREFQTLAETMAAHGLRTGAFVASAVLAADRGLDQGFQTYSTAGTESCRDARARRPADAVVDDALAWLAKDEAPFFAWIHLYDTHRPYRLPDEYSRGYPDPYLAAITFEDSQIARVVKHLRERRVLDDTLIVIAGDHGESLGDHGEDSHGIFIYQETLHVPLIMRGPGVKPGRVDHVVRLVDVMPTILEVAGWPVSPSDGVSLWRLMKGLPEEKAREVYSESLYPERFGWAPLRSVRADRYKVIDAPRPELYDLELDPAEQSNLISAKASIAAAMLARVRAHKDDHLPQVETPISDERAAQLASLGYVAKAPAMLAGASPLGADPKDMINEFNRFTSLQAAHAGAPPRCLPTPPTR